MNTGNRLVTDEIRALVGARAPVRTTQDAVSTSEIRRFAQATFDDARIFHDDAAAKASRFGTRVAPGMFTMLSLRPNIPFVDDTMRSAQPGDDTYRVAVTENLPQPAAWSTLYRFHASDDVEFFRLPHVGDTLSAHTSLIDIYEKSGRNGPLAFYVVRTDWKNQRDELVAREDVNLVWTAHAAKRESAPVQPALPRDPPPMPPARPLDLPRVNFEDVAEGQALPEKMIRVTVPTVVRWQMASESYRRDHFDHDYATQVGKLPNIIASAMWTLSCRWSYLNQFAGCDGWVWKMSHSVRARMNIGDTLTFGGTVTRLTRRDAYGLVEAEVNLTNQDGVIAAPGRASIALPYRDGAAVPYPFVPCGPN